MSGCRKWEHNAPRPGGTPTLCWPHMHKRWSCVLLFTLLALVLAGCSGAPASAPKAKFGPRAASGGWEAKATPAATALIPKASIEGFCRQITRGSIGPFSAPYTECARLTPEGHSEVDYLLYSPQRGLVYAPGVSRPGDVPEECATKLTGGWWEYHAADPQTLACTKGWLWIPSPA
jgi:hypothetical protein